MKIIGITGGIGAGKSTVLQYLERVFHAYVIQADAVGHLVMEPEQVCYGQIIDLFGKKIIKNDKTIDRSMVSDVVFSNEEMLEKLNAIVHPAVKTYILKKMQEERVKGCRLFVIEAALLLEEHYQDFCDEIWYVHADREVRISRLMDSRGYSREKAVNIIGNQASEEFFRKNADFVVENNGDLGKTHSQVKGRLQKI